MTHTTTAPMLDDTAPIDAAPARKGKGRKKAAAPKDAARKAGGPKRKAAPVKAAAVWLTVGMGCAIPALALALSHCAGKMAGHGLHTLAGWALLLCAAVLSVSLPHLADAIADITRSGPRAAWALAVAVDVSLVFCETACVLGGGAVSHTLLYAMMTGLTLSSMALNCWAFLRTPHN